MNRGNIKDLLIYKLKLQITLFDENEDGRVAALWKPQRKQLLEEVQVTRLLIFILYDPQIILSIKESALLAGLLRP
jgi:hypothetical protein